MQLTYLHIRNFKSIRDLEIRGIDRALILVGKNNTGKTSVLDAVCAVCGCYEVREEDFNEKRQAIRIDAGFCIEEEDLKLFHCRGLVSQYRRFDVWRRVFGERLPSFKDGELSFTFHVNLDGKVRYEDPYRKNNPYIPMVLPHIYRITADRELRQLQNDLLMFQEDEELSRLRSGRCIFEASKKCNHCFQCIGLINKKKPEELTAFETARLLEYKIYQLNLSGFSRKVNENFFKNGGYEEIRYTLNCDTDQMFSVEVTAHNRQRGSVKPVGLMGKGMRSIYMLSLLETYISEQSRIPSIIVVEDPEIFLHPQLQKTCSEILYRLSKKNQVIFKTHSPDLLFNFSIRQIRQVVLDEERYSVIREKADLGQILDDLGYGANDLLNVSFVFIVEGKQDKSRLPLLLEKYYSEIYDDKGNLTRISIITTNSCTNIKTYANLKYMNQVYLRDQFLMIRDGDGKDPEELASQLCRYYDERSLEDADRLPKVTRRNVLILKYYSFENYFFNPTIMAKLGIVKSEDAFYDTLFDKWREYLYRIRSGQQLMEIMGRDFTSPEDMKAHMEEILTYMRGHNLYDLFYGPFRDREQEILREYIDMAPREEFKDILDAIDRFVYFDSRKKA
ncbi:OLD family endonuclease [Enterocloster aldenensis]|mgnify:FL=1|uniref:ATP-dependent nuclease n=1 Tax=Enterocloster aldenensis TaxID=358742 RepID=UPI000E408ADA|nr:AAA family ATPase [uncultured Lachnoclostridium sp.]RGC25844.1 OLD family endonuclease [Enterocloster aldenensis]